MRLNKQWFDLDCQKARKKYIRVKNRFRNLNTCEAYDLVSKSFKEYKNTIKVKKKDYENRLHKTLNDKVKWNPKEFWELIKGKKTKTDKINLSEFKKTL